MPPTVFLPSAHYFPAIVRDECDSPIDALVLLGMPRDEATDLVAASWDSDSPANSTCILCDIDGGRPVVALLTPDGRWAACNAFPDKACTDRQEALRQLNKLLKRGRRGFVAEWRLELPG